MQTKRQSPYPPLQPATAEAERVPAKPDILSGEIYEINGNVYCAYSDLSIYAREWNGALGWVWRQLFVDLEDE